MRINEIFYSLQGEGYHSGKACVFVRFSGCNLRCLFCDTDFHSFVNMTEDEVVDAVINADEGRSRFVVLTGGEPTMQVTDSFLDKLHQLGYYVAMESNGALHDGNDFEVNWLTISPKNPYLGSQIPILAHQADEVKLIVDKESVNEGIMACFEDEIEADHYYLQPCDTGNEEDNKEIIKISLDLIKRNPKWKLSLQTQKILNIR